MTNAVTYFEISGHDPAALRRFYTEVLGLPFGDPDEDGYAMVAPTDEHIPGGLWDNAEQGAYAIPLVRVPDVDATVAAAAAGGTTTLENEL